MVVLCKRRAQPRPLATTIHVMSFRKMGSGVCIRNVIKNHRIIGRVVFPGSRNMTFFSASSPNLQLLDIFNPTEVRVWGIGAVALAQAATAV